MAHHRPNFRHLPTTQVSNRERDERIARGQAVLDAERAASRIHVSNADLLQAAQDSGHLVIIPVAMPTAPHPSGDAALERLNAPLSDQEVEILERFSTRGLVQSADPDVVYGVTTVGDLLDTIPNEGDRTHVAGYEVTNKGSFDDVLHKVVVDTAAREVLTAKTIVVLRKMASKAGLPNAYKGGYTKAQLVEYLVTR